MNMMETLHLIKSGDVGALIGDFDLKIAYLLKLIDKKCIVVPN